MSWDAAIHGRIRVPLEQRDAWLASPLDWAAVDGHDAWDGQVLASTVAEVLDWSSRSFGADDLPDSGPIQFLEFEQVGDELRVASFQDKDGFIDTMLGIAAAFAAAAAHGGRGELIGMGMMTASFGWRLRVADGKAQFWRVPDEQVSALDDHPDARAIEERVMLAIADLD